MKTSLVRFSIIICLLLICTTSIYGYTLDSYGIINETGETICEPQFENVKICPDGLIMVQKEKKWGWIDSTGRIIIEPQFEDAYPFTDGCAAVKKENKWGWINSSGKVIIEPQFDDVRSFDNGHAAVKKGNKWGWIDNSGKVIIEPQFDDVRFFPDGHAAVKIKNKWGWTNNTGKIIVDPQFDYIGRLLNDFIDVSKYKSFLGAQTTYWGLMDINGKIIVEPKYSSNTTINNFSDGMAAVSTGSLYGFINTTGKEVIKPIFSDCKNFSEGFAAVKKSVSLLNTEEKWGFIDKTGKVVIKPQFDNAYSFSEGLAAVKIKDKWGWIDKTGKLIIQPQFDDPFSFSQVQLSNFFYRNYTDITRVPYSFSNGIVKVKKDNKWGWIDKTGKTIIESQFDDAHSFSDGLAAVKINNKWGWVNNTGKMVIEPKYRDVNDFKNGLAVIRNYLKISTDKKPNIMINPDKVSNYEVHYYSSGSPDYISSINGQKLVEFYYHGFQGKQLYKIDIHFKLKNIGLEGNTNIKINAGSALYEDVCHFKENGSYTLDIHINVIGKPDSNDYILFFAIKPGEGKEIGFDIKRLNISQIESIQTDISETI